MNYDKLAKRFREAIHNNETTRVQTFLMHMSIRNQQRFIDDIKLDVIFVCNTSIWLMLIKAASTKKCQHIIEYYNYGLFKGAIRQGVIPLVELMLHKIDPVKKQAMLAAGIPTLLGKYGTTVYLQPAVQNVKMLELLFSELDSSTKKQIPSFICWDAIGPINMVALPTLLAYADKDEITELTARVKDNLDCLLNKKPDLVRRVCAYRQLHALKLFTDLDDIVYQYAVLKRVCKNTSQAFKGGVHYLIIHSFLLPELPKNFAIAYDPSVEKDLYNRMFDNEEKKFDKSPGL